MEPRFDRAALVRMVVAEQWAVAVTLCYVDGVGYQEHGGLDLTAPWAVVSRKTVEALAALPCAVDVVAERLGER